jgi:4-hydroxybutyryl-CoA dehydratase/vinylacetyl-CoA-Delta-isomerase
VPADDLAGGYLATMPGEESFDNPEISMYVKKYYVANPEHTVEDRAKMGRHIENVTRVTTMAEDVIEGSGDVEGIALNRKKE